MRFSCEGCNAKYMISDDKVVPGGVKVRCKKCGHVTVVRRSEPELEPQSSSAPPVAEWWVAIDEQPVGPIAPEEVRRHWDAGTLHAESLVWHVGLVEWAPIHAVPQLAGPLGAVAPPPPPEGDGTPQDSSWRPNAASALAGLDELPPGDGYPEGAPGAAVPGAEAPPAGEPAEPSRLEAPPAPPEPVPVGQDPTGVQPLPMAGLERTGERRIAATPGPRGPGVRGASAQKPRNESRSLPLVLAVALVVVAAAAVGLWLLTR
jgi:predicted Zn finger-like uncharacterized protein